MKSFEKHLLKALRREGWEHVETFDLPDLWWASRAWKIRSVRAHFGAELFLIFVGCYVEGREVAFDDPVWYIAVSSQLPGDRLPPSAPSELIVTAHDYPQRVEPFVAEFRTLTTNEPFSAEEPKDHEHHPPQDQRS